MSGKCRMISTLSHAHGLQCLRPPSLKTMDTIGKRQRPVFSLGVSQHMHKQKLSLIGRRSNEIVHLVVRAITLTICSRFSF